MGWTCHGNGLRESGDHDETVVLMVTETRTEFVQAEKE